MYKIVNLLNCVLFAAAEVMFRRADFTVFESDLPVQFEILLQPSQPMPNGDITIEVIATSDTAIGMSIHSYTMLIIILEGLKFHKLHR